MNKLNFADRYAQAGLSPGGAIITSRQAPAERILKDLITPRIFDLVQCYFGQPDLDLTWLRNEFIQEDPAFSLINNQRECIILAAAILDAKIAQGHSQTILALLTTSMSGKRAVAEFGWLLDEAENGFLTRAVAARQSSKIEPNLTVPATPKLTEELAASPVNDWPGLLANVAKVRAESSGISNSIATQASAALSAMQTQLLYMREETQILWWLFGEHSRTFNRHFSTYSSGVAAIIAGVDLGNLTTASTLGPVAAPAMLERVLRLTNGEKGKKISLAAALDGIDTDELHALKIFGKDQPPRIFPVMTAIAKAKGAPGAWQGAFEKATGVSPTVEFEPIELGIQIYHEHLLGQLP
jgi:hypothetical protein